MSDLLDRMEKHLEWLKQNPSELETEALYCLAKAGLIAQDESFDQYFKIKW